MRTRNAITTIVALAYLLMAIGLFFHSHVTDHFDQDGMSVADSHVSTTCSLCQATPQSSSDIDRDLRAFEDAIPAAPEIGIAIVTSRSIDFTRQFRLAPKNSPPA